MSIWLVFLISGLSMLLSTEAGYRFGLQWFRANDGGWKVQIGAVNTAVLGLLGLLLGFTFAMAVQRYDARRFLVVREANAIGTTYLRASFLPPAHQEPVRDALRRYVAARLAIRARATSLDQIIAGRQFMAPIQAELWRYATASAAEAPTPITATFITSLNELIDLDEERIAAARADIPGGVWLMLVLVACAGCLTTGYQAGAEGKRTGLTIIFLPLLITVVIVMIFDLVQPLQGMIGVSQQALIDVQQAMR